MNMSHTSNSGGKSAKILCGTCQSPAEAVPDPQPESKVTCSGCGKEDRFDNVMGSVKEYVTHCAAKSINDAMAKAVRGSKILKMTSKPTSHRSFPWITSDLGI